MCLKKQPGAIIPKYASVDCITLQRNNDIEFIISGRLLRRMEVETFAYFTTPYTVIYIYIYIIGIGFLMTLRIILIYPSHFHRNIPLPRRQ